MGFEEEDIMVEALPDAEVDRAAASVAVVTMLAAASADCVELRKKKRGLPRFPEDMFQVKMFPEWGSNP